MIVTANVRVEGITPMMLANVRLADEIDPYTVAISDITSNKTRKKTDEGRNEISRLQWFGSLYVSSDANTEDDLTIKGGRIICPGANIEAMMRSSCKLKNKGKLAPAGFFCSTEPEIIYNGPKCPSKLYGKKEFVDTRIVTIPGRKTKIPRTRPIFKEWALEFNLLIETQIFDEESARKFLETAGIQCGLNDGRPKFGRFEITRFETGKATDEHDRNEAISA